MLMKLYTKCQYLPPLEEPEEIPLQKKYIYFSTFFMFRRTNVHISKYIS
jgi:hypothetical protein